jgi:hypothetical protein
VNRRNLLLSLSAAAVLPTLMLAKGGNSNELRMRTDLTGARIKSIQPSGHADFRARDNRSRLNVQVEDVNVPAGTVLEVLVNGNLVGQITVQSVILGGELELNTQDGQLVPNVVKGDIVVVRMGGSPILAGVF